MKRLLAVSHASVLPVNQWPYARLLELGWEPTIIVPSSWRNDYGEVTPTALPMLEGRLRPIPARLRARPQRHVYLTRATELIRRLRPDSVFVEADCFSMVALQWTAAAERAGVPSGIQAAENLDRPLPLVARLIRERVLARAAFAAARSPAAAERLRDWGYTGLIRVTPHAVPSWTVPAHIDSGHFVVGYAGRLVPQKGVLDLSAAVAQIGGARMLAVGDGPLRAELERAGAEVRTDAGHAGMPEMYSRMDVLVLPSRSTPTWTEQFGRVLVEALWCGVPLIGSSSGEIPWVIGETGGGIVFPEGDVAALAAALSSLRDDSARRAELAARGRAGVERLFAVTPATAPLHPMLEEVTS